MVDRRASPYAGLRSTSVREKTRQANHQRSTPCQAVKPFPSPAAQRLRSTMRCSAYEGCQVGVNFPSGFSGEVLAARSAAESRAAAVRSMNHFEAPLTGHWLV